MSVVTISGSQGQGKSTVLNSLAAKGYNVVERKTSRSILKEWGFTLDEVNRYPPLTRAFQDEVIRRHLESMKPLLDDDKFYFMERSFADIFTYAILAIGSFNEYNNWMEDYYGKCLEAQAHFHSIFHLTGRTFVPQDDGVRSTSRFFGQTVDREIYSYLKIMDTAIGKNQLFSIAHTDNEERVKIILENSNRGV
jgi:predicted ATPase